MPRRLRCVLASGLFDPISDLASIAQQRGLWMHVDACVGGYAAPFARKAGYPIPDFDFAVPGVCSISADLHKYGHTAWPGGAIASSWAVMHFLGEEGLAKTCRSLLDALSAIPSCCSRADTLRKRTSPPGPIPSLRLQKR